MNEVNQMNGTIEKQYSFIADFTEAYSFRIHVEYLKGVHKDGYYTFSKDTIKFIKMNEEKDGDMLTEVTINTKDLTYYEFNEEKPLNVGIDFERFENAVKDISKTESIRMSLIRNDDCFKIQIIGGNNTDGNCRHVKMKKIEQLEDYSGINDDYKRNLDDQNFVVPLNDFSKKCKTIATNCNEIFFYQYMKGLKMEKITANTSPEPYCKIGIIDEPTIISGNGINLQIKDETPLSKFICKSKIRSKNVKNLSKLTNISSRTNVKFYFEDDTDTPIRILYLMGCYGNIVNHLQSIS